MQRTSVALYAALFALLALADIRVQFLEGAPKDTFTISDIGDVPQRSIPVASGS